MKICVVCGGGSTHKIAFTFKCLKGIGAALEEFTVMSKPFCETCIDTYLGYINAEDELEAALFMNLTAGIRRSGYLVKVDGVRRVKQLLDYIPPKATWEAIKHCELCAEGTARFKLVLKVPFVFVDSKGNPRGKPKAAFIETGPMCADCTPMEPDANKHFNQEQLALAFMEIHKLGGVYDPHKCSIAVMHCDWKPPEGAETIVKDVASEAKAQRDALQKAADKALIDLRSEVEARKRKANNASNN